MHKLLAIVFCTVTLAVTVAFAWVLYPKAAMSEEQFEQLTTPQDPELFNDVEITDFGEVPVFDMMLHYIDNPPDESEGTETKVRFQGC